MDILHEASQPEQLVGVRSDVIEREYGQCVKSFGEWAEQWTVSKDTARYFIDMLEKKEMLKTESLLFSTRLTINNINAFVKSTHDKKELVTKKENKKVKSLHSQIKEIFLAWYKQVMDDEDYYWNPIDGAKVKPIVDKILFKIKMRHEKQNIPPKTNYDEEIIEGWLYLLNSITDPWLLKELSMKLIDSKFNQIFSNLKANAKSITANRKPSKIDGYKNAYTLVMESRGTGKATGN